MCQPELSPLKVIPPPPVRLPLSATSPTPLTPAYAPRPYPLLPLLSPSQRTPCTHITGVMFKDLRICCLHIQRPTKAMLPVMRSDFLPPGRTDRLYVDGHPGGDLSGLPVEGYRVLGRLR